MREAYREWMDQIPFGMLLPHSPDEHQTYMGRKGVVGAN